MLYASINSLYEDGDGNLIATEPQDVTAEFETVLRQFSPWVFDIPEVADPT